MKNNFRDLQDGKLSTVAEQAHSVIGGDIAGYGVTPAQVAALDAGKTALTDAITDLANAKAAYEAALAARDAGRGATLDALSNIGATIYNNAAVSSAMLADAGYAIHAKGKSTILPRVITELMASPDGSGNANLRWSRNGNKPGVVFVLEQSPDGSAWHQVHTTTKAKATITGLAVGAAAWFRVRATKNEVWSLPSDPVAIWATSGDRLQLHAA